MTSPIDEKDAKRVDSVDNAQATIQDLQLGVWKLRIASEPLHLRKMWTDFLSAAPVFWRLAIDVFRASPYHFSLFLICQMAYGLQESVLLHMSNKLLQIIEIGIVAGKLDGNAIISAILSRVVLTIIFAWVSWRCDHLRNVVHTKVTSYFQLLLMKANLELDLPTSQEQGSKQQVNARDAWTALSSIISFLTDMLRSGSQLAVIAHISQSTGGPIFVLLSLSHPLASMFVTRSLWEKVCFGYINNPEYQRIKALEKFASGDLRQDIITGGLANWITDEYQELHRKLGETNTMHPYHQFENEYASSLPRDIFLNLLEFAPTIFCALNALLNPHKFSITSIAILQQSSTALRYSLQTSLIRAQMLRRNFVSLRSLYRSSTVSNSMSEGTTPYPPNGNKKSSKGMSFELSNVSFSYPGSQKTTTALKNVSLTISSGQLVIIVGANGSGKSTLIRLLSRLYDSTSGSVHIDGKPSAEYHMADLHEATALLSQDSNLYPLSLGENIGLGNPVHVRDDEMIAQAAREGGAADFIAKLKDGFQTVLEPITEVFQIHLYQNKTHVLYKEMETLRKKIDISGGERQRVVAARSFMRFQSGKVKFVAVDEPSSALDAEAELKLFENLIKVREGKTMIFVTHRFGHLTRHADQIICMKDGAILEVGSHEQLMAMKGEYANLYEIQASAFSQSFNQETPKVLVEL